MFWRKKDKPQASPFKLLLRTALVVLACAFIGIGSLMEDMLRVARNGLHTHDASGDIVFVKIDDKALRQVGRWPWSRRYHAALTDRITQAGANRIFFDVAFEAKSNPRDDRTLAEAIERSGRVTLPVRSHLTKDGELPVQPELARVAEIATISVDYNHQNAAWKLPFGATLGDRQMPGMASKLADRPGPVGEVFPVDYSIDPTSIRSVSAADVLTGTFDERLFQGKDVVIGAASEVLGDQYFIPGWGKMAGAYIQMIGAETLKKGRPVDLGWIPAFLVSLILVATALRQSRASVQNALLAALGLSLLVVPVFLELRLIFVDVVPALLVLAIIGSVIAHRRFRARGLVDTVSGLPNLTALRAYEPGREQTLVVARVMNYSEIVAALPPKGESALIEQIVARLGVGSTERTLYQGDGGIFAWFEDSRVGVGHHIEALYSLLRNPVRAAGLSIDLAVSFGIDIGSSRSLSNRLGSALVAAEEAAHAGLKWKYYDPETLQNASWKLSMLSQLDDAIDNGEVWIAFQPKLDLATHRVIGAEALARWTHPDKGPIAASEFVAAAEQHDRIGKLTMFVLDKALAAAARVNQGGQSFDVAVNLSGRLLGDRGLTKTIASLLELHQVEPERLTLELTETAALAGSGEALDMLASLGELGVRISIDDYGTGFSTLEYLKKIPASEIKIDQSFVKGMCDNRSDRLMVQSTIALAHSLGRKVVAEGVEQRAVLDALIAMKCDLAQGYIIGRPMSLGSLIKRLTQDQRREVA